VARRLIGLDVGTNAVTVAEVAPGDPPVLRAFGQVGLPMEAMAEGEVVDSAAVTAAIRRLWREVGLPKRAEVRLGIASPRVIVRQVDLPEMADEDIDGALQYQASDLIPIPLEDARFDHLVLEHLEPEPVPGGEERGAQEPPEGHVRILLAAAQRTIVDRLVDSVRAAGLRVGSLDLVPLALVRSLGRRVATDGEGAEALVSFGAGVTVVVVHESGTPRFVRVVGGGGHSLTEAVARTLDIPFATAETIKRGSDEIPLDVAGEAEEALARPLADLLEDVRGSLDYYRTQPEALPLLRIVATGGGAQLADLDVRLRALVDLPVEMAQPRLGLTVGDIGFADEQLPLLDPYLAVAAGLALGGLPGAGRSIDLLRGEARKGGPRRNLLLAGAAGAALVAGLVALSLIRQSAISEKQDDLDAQEQRNAELQSQIDDLADAAQRDLEIEGLRLQIAGLLEPDVSWASLLQEIARTIPNDVWLTDFQGQVVAPSTEDLPEGGPQPEETPGAEGTETTETTTTTAPTTGETAPSGGLASVGSVDFTAVGLDYPAVAAWLQRISEIPAFSGLWVSNAEVSSFGGRDVVDFASNAELTAEANSSRAQRIAEGGDE